MKIVLIVPNIQSYDSYPSVSVAALKGYLTEKTIHQARIVDLVFHKRNWRQYISDVIQKEKPDLVGFSVLSFNYPDALEIAGFIKKRFNLKIIFGGVHVILSPQEVIEKEVVDIICVGEGEEVLKDLLDKSLECKNVNGIWYKDNKTIIKNETRMLIQDLDTLPFPDYSDFELDKYFPMNHKHLPIMGSRGCPYDCSFCSNHALKKKLDGTYVRFRSVDNIIAEIEQRVSQYADKGMNFLYFFDDTFILHKEFVNNFCKKYQDNGLDNIFKWTANVRANLVTEDLVRTMKNAGCYEMRMGVESGNDFIRNTIYKRNMSKEQLVKAFKIIKKNGLLLRLDFILGAPYETLEMMQETFDFAQQSNGDNIFFARLYLFPETEITKVCEKEHMIKTHLSLGEKGMPPVTKTKFVTEKQINDLFRKIIRWQGKRYINKGLELKGMKFLTDILLFLIYYKHRYLLEMNQIYRWNVQKYLLKTV
ncbi:MAG: B12-binding domain-containing radical SAM protein [Candidatus Thermoplasmatota archaeon]|nr:B12-binding domain-containing radical SAM protein [Candidatus Thermoplasmatota archaeon]